MSKIVIPEVKVEVTVGQCDPPHPRPVVVATIPPLVVSSWGTRGVPVKVLP